MHDALKSTGRRLAVLTLDTVAFNALLHAAVLDAYLSKSITPMAPPVACNVADGLTSHELIRALGQPMVIETKPGAGTVLGTWIVARAPEDGHAVGQTYASRLQAFCALLKSDLAKWAHVVRDFGLKTA